MKVFSTIDKGFIVLFVGEAILLGALVVCFIIKRINKETTDRVYGMITSTLVILGGTLSGLIVYLAIKGIAWMTAQII